MEDSSSQCCCLRMGLIHRDPTRQLICSEQQATSSSVTVAGDSTPVHVLALHEMQLYFTCSHTVQENLDYYQFSSDRVYILLHVHSRRGERTMSWSSMNPSCTMHPSKSIP